MKLPPIVWKSLTGESKLVRHKHLVRMKWRYQSSFIEAVLEANMEK